MSEPSKGDLPSLADITRLPPQKNPPDIAGPSQEKAVDNVGPSPPFTFFYNLTPAIYLKFAVEALSDPQCNYRGLGRIDVDKQGFNITVQNLRNNYIGHLWLNPPTFVCFEPLKGKRFNFQQLLSPQLAELEDASRVYVSQRKENDKLEIIGGGAAAVKISVDLLEIFSEIRMFPEISFFCEATIPPGDFRLMVQHLLQEEMPKQVSVKIRENTARLKVRSEKAENSWEANYPMLGGTGMEAGKSYTARFLWTNAELLQKAIELDVGLVLGIHTKKFHYIYLRFILRNLGYLEYLSIANL